MAMLEGKSGIVTGAAQGFGRATAERLVSACSAVTVACGNVTPAGPVSVIESG